MITLEQSNTIVNLGNAISAAYIAHSRRIIDCGNAEDHKNNLDKLRYYLGVLVEMHHYIASSND